MTTDRTLTDEDLRHLTQAGEWKMLRSLAGWKVCMTGKMSLKRDQLARLVEAAGGEFQTSVNGQTSLLIVADDSVWSNKIEAAEARGVKALRESEFAAELLPTPAELLSGVRAGFGSERA